MKDPEPAVTVVIVSDYGGGERKAWDDLRVLLQALGRQDFDESVEYLLIESADVADRMPEELSAILHGLRVLSRPVSSSYELKNEGVTVARSELVVILDADCVPEPGWLRHLVGAARAQPQAAAVSGRTTYAGATILERTLAVLSRAYLDPGGRGRSIYISNNNALVRRSVWLSAPLSTEGGRFGSRMQSEELRRRGCWFFFEPDARVVHDFEGWSMERDIRRNIGFSTIRIRQVDPQMPYAWMVRMGSPSIPLIVAARTVASLADCVRAGSNYGVRWFEQPVAWALAVVVNLMEVGGMLRAFGDRPITRTAYR